MAQKGMRPEVKAAKLRNNKVGVLVCSHKDCEEEFYIARPVYPAVRECPSHFRQSSTEVGEAFNTKRTKSLLFRLGLI